ncbi:hypothetical protein UlMin_014902 [Ulmus minor]
MIRRKSNRIDCLKLDDGEWIYSRNQIGNMFTTRFESDLVAAMRDLFMIDTMAHNINDINIVLIPKKPNPTRPNHFRPISVCNVAYRAIHSMKKKKGALGWMALKIDLEKAYDRVSWQFIEEVLAAFGFDSRWVRWVSTCISSVTMKLLINGSHFGDIKPKKGLKQGDPLSPYLFILCTEILSRLFISKVENGVINGLKLTRGGPPLHHLMFAGDIFVFGKACVTEAMTIKDTLDSFCSWSGISFNNSKSSIFFSANTRGVVANQLTSLLGFERILVDSSYLGLPIFRANKKNDFNFLVDCLDSKLTGWKLRLLSKVSRLTLIKFVALSLPIYAMHTAKIPKAICAKLDARIQRFW